MTKAITIIQTRRSATGFGLVHPHHSVLKQLNLILKRSKQVLAAIRRSVPFRSAH